MRVKKDVEQLGKKTIKSKTTMLAHFWNNAKNCQTCRNSTIHREGGGGGGVGGERGGKSRKQGSFDLEHSGGGLDIVWNSKTSKSKQSLNIKKKTLQAIETSLQSLTCFLHNVTESNYNVVRVNFRKMI